MVTSGVTTRAVRDAETKSVPNVTARPPSVSPSARPCERQKAAASITTTGASVSAISGEMVRRSPAFTGAPPSSASAPAGRGVGGRPAASPAAGVPACRRSAVRRRLPVEACSARSCACSPSTVCLAVVISGCGQKPSSTSAAIMRANMPISRFVRSANDRPCVSSPWNARCIIQSA